MKRRAPKSSPNHHAALHGPKANPCRALMRVDGTAIRKKIKKDYEKALRDLENARLQLDQFQKTDVPQFTQWLNAHFGALLTELRELAQKIGINEELIFQVEDEVLFGGCSPARAYQRVMAFRENPPPPPDFAPHDPPPAGDDRSGLPPEFDEAVFESIFGDEADPSAFAHGAFDPFGPNGEPGGHTPHWDERRRRSETPDSGRIKELYRNLVRRLHPDAQAKMTPQKTEWWHQAQAAYEAGDAGQLEVILTLCEIDDSGTTAHTTASLLHRITAQLKRSLRELKRQVTDNRRHPAWNFSHRDDRDLMASRMRQQMTRDLDTMSRHWRETEDQIAQWKAAAERLRKPQKPRQPKRLKPDMECPF